ncbi:hypothetical protein CNMCM5623_002888 [Aspergillus felis]|uniref:Derlin n=1 Tax=Aspergillus felis TaxID=1287682 RepID=A0A8H6QB21_9EURO|nr:hypothetical protein CNMCM5623_002888 [Aspergillus felis]KAF7183441.1 hypothetical protein CNMCM7691_003640 [Aspergillus felis]
MDRFWSAPPVTRTLTALTFAQSALVYGGLLSGYYVVFIPRLIFRLPPQLWRLFSPFLLTGSGLSFIFDLYFMYTYGSALETGSPRFSSPGDFFTYVLFVAFVIMTTTLPQCFLVSANLLFEPSIVTSRYLPAQPQLAEAVPGSEEDHPYIPYSASLIDPIGLYALWVTAGYFLSGVIFTSALILAFVYTFAQDNRGKKATFIIIQIPIEYLPWAMLVLTLVMAGWPAALSEGMGIIAAHLYDFLTRLYPTFGGGRNYLTTPAFVRRFFAAYAPRGEYRTYGTAYRPASQNPPSASSGWASSFQGSWGGRGPGRRLGGS